MAGEMSHHDVLDAVANGISVILCEHSNTERGFLSELRDALALHLQNKINIIVSEKDKRSSPGGIGGKNWRQRENSVNSVILHRSIQLQSLMKVLSIGPVWEWLYYMVPQSRG